MAKQGNVEGFIYKPKNADNLSGLVWDLHDAVMDYQVCIQAESQLCSCLTPISDFITTRNLSKELPVHCESHPSPSIYPLM